MENVKVNWGIADESWTRTRVIARVGVFVALAVVGALLKIPSPTGTVALDSAAGYFSAVAFGILPGGAIAALGHLASAATAGFPLTLPIHLLIALQMAVFAASFGYLARKLNLPVAIVAASLLNGVLAPLSMVPLFGMAFFTAMVVPLMVGSAVNVALAAGVFKSISRLGSAR
ncbi:alpha-ribazole transporter [Clostridiales bacterium PH28_bin88]|nr:alpha-ribazole transporter [Clostridiales bacterium PH28_bin88]